MSIFGRIKDAIFGADDDEADQARRTSPAPRPKPTEQRPASARVAEPKPKPVIDIPNHLDSMPGADKLNWRTSIVDLMKLIGVDSDYESRRALARELGRDNYTGSAEDNVWLHRRTMRELSTNGGTVPPEFLD